MQRQMMTTAVTMDQIQQQLATVANNISNVGTTGFQERSANFSDLLTQQVNNMLPVGTDQTDAANRLTPAGLRLGLGSKVGDTQLDMSEGQLEQTGNPLDLALTNNRQYFTVDLNGATAYTRAGDFNAQPGGTGGSLRLVTKSGEAVLGTNGRPIQLPAGYSDLQINAAGTITAVMPSGARINAGQLGIVQINRPQLLQNQGDSLLTLPNLAQLGVGINQVVQPVAAGAASVSQGHLEGSNVDLTGEMTNLINLERNYQLNAQSVSMSDQMAGLVNGLLQ